MGVTIIMILIAQRKLAVDLGGFAFLFCVPTLINGRGGAGGVCGLRW